MTNNNLPAFVEKSVQITALSVMISEITTSEVTVGDKTQKIWTVKGGWVAFHVERQEIPVKGSFFWVTPTNPLPIVSHGRANNILVCLEGEAPNRVNPVAKMVKAHCKRLQDAGMQPVLGKFVRLNVEPTNVKVRVYKTVPNETEMFTDPVMEAFVKDAPTDIPF